MSEKRKELKMLNDNVLLFQYTQKETKGGIILSTQSQDTQIKTICVVSAVGTQVQSEDIKEGVFVVIPRHTGQWLDFDGEKYVLVKEKDILAVIEGMYAAYEDGDSNE